MQKNIEFEKGNLIIGYCDNSQDISVYKSGKYTEPITLKFIPKNEMSENQCLEYTNRIIDQVIAETKIIISENKEFYKNFEVEFNSEFLGYYLYRHHLNRDLLIVSESWMRVKCKLKEAEVNVY